MIVSLLCSIHGDSCDFCAKKEKINKNNEIEMLVAAQHEMTSKI